MARRNVPGVFFEYMEAGSYSEHTRDANVDDMRAIKLRQRVLVDMSRRSLKTTVLGEELALRHVDQHALAQLDGAHVVDIGVARMLRIGAGLHVLEEHAGHVALGDLPQVVDAHGVTQFHPAPRLAFRPAG